MENILVSILMPVYNEEGFIKSTLESIQHQTHKNIEVIIVDDYSNDSTWNIIKEISIEDSRIKIIKNKTKGKVNAINLAWKESSGSMIVFLGGDDILPPNSIYVRLKNLLYRNADVSTGKIKTFSEFKNYNNILYPKKNQPNLSGGATAFSRNFAKKIFPIPPILPNEDTWTELHIQYLDANIVWSEDIILYYRIHSNNSMGFDASFNIKNDIISKRKKALDYFKTKFESELSTDDIIKLQEKIKLESYRYNKDIIGVLFKNQSHYKEKLQALAYSSPFIYATRKALNKYLSGL
ncbi:glycosyltransferase family 2 protein [Xenorhabdus sp. Flor]|uniref:glycosyltransferase family 2 protein n=1 Tax=Xenorhabdus cabanillasii TaxID=351673 RepID=UPI0019A9F9ED|nr:glycosyltransferase family 2 protein [Xenorhabdus sp. Flor]MBD2813264.1 glycosyltransferase family 2 protein [Xenorhabdus sp. Flor]